MAINKKLIHFKTFENFNSQKLSANEENTKYTLGIDGEVLDGAPDILYQSLVWIKDVQKQWTHGQLYGESSTVDTEMSDTSDNAVQNKVIKAYADKVAQEAKDAAIRDALEDLSADEIYIKYTDNKMSLLLAQDGGLGTPEGMQGLGIVSIPEGLLEDYVNVQADWLELDSNSDAYIKHKTHGIKNTQGPIVTIQPDMTTVGTDLFQVYTDVPFMVNGIPYGTLDMLNKDFVGSDFGPEVIFRVVEKEGLYYVRHIQNPAVHDIKYCARVNIIPIPESYFPDTIARKSDIERTVDDQLSESSTNPVQNKVITDALANKVDKVTGKGLSTNDYTTTEKNKLAGIAEGAEVNVQSDWNATSGDAYIKNKPSLATVATSGSYNDLSNKPIIPIETIVDTSMSSTSTNPVQNKIIKAYIDNAVVTPVESVTSTSKSIEPNKYYKWTSAMSSLTITLATPTNTSILNNYMFEFTTSSSGCTLNVPSTVKWANGEAPTIEASKTYQVSIINNLAVVSNF